MIGMTNRETLSYCRTILRQHGLVVRCQGSSLYAVAFPRQSSLVSNMTIGSLLEMVESGYFEKFTQPQP